MAILIHVLAAVLYAVAAWARWPARGPAHAFAVWLPPIGLAVHALGLVVAIATPQGLDISFANAVSLVAALCVLVALVSGTFRSLPASATIFLPVAAAAALLPALAVDPHRFPYSGASWASIHIAVSLVAYAILSVAAITALIMTGLEKRLHRGVPAAAGDHTPPLLTLERYLFRMVGAGFILLTLALASGALFSEQVFGKPFAFTHKGVFSILAWLTFGALIAGRWRFGWRGRRATAWIVAGTLFLLLAYLGSKFVLEILLGR
jgi:ABC-type uncharacterized transport system permease subunit